LKLWRVGKEDKKGKKRLRYVSEIAHVPYIDSHILIGSEVKLEKQFQN